MDTILEILETIKPGADFASSHRFYRRTSLRIHGDSFSLYLNLMMNLILISRFLILSQRTLSLWKAFTTWFRKF